MKLYNFIYKSESGKVRENDEEGLIFCIYIVYSKRLILSILNGRTRKSECLARLGNFPLEHTSPCAVSIVKQEFRLTGLINAT